MLRVFISGGFPALHIRILVIRPFTIGTPLFSCFILPVITAVAAVNSERRFIFIALVVVSIVFVPIEWRLFREMMQPGLWGDALERP